MRTSQNLLNRALEAASAKFRGETSVVGEAVRPPKATLSELVESHFTQFSSPNHPCRRSLQVALDLLGKNPAVIYETGSSAWGTNSTLLFDDYVNSFGGALFTVDNRIEPMVRLVDQCSSKTTLCCDDSVEFLTKMVGRGPAPDLVYLDSWDVDWSAPVPSAVHGLSEFLTVLPFLRKGSLLIIDDTPKDVAVMREVQPTFVDNFLQSQLTWGFMPGKGVLVNEFIASRGLAKKIFHEYQVVWQF